LGEKYNWKEQVREGCISRFESFPDANYGEDRHFIVGNMGFSEWTLTGTSPSGERVEVCGTDHLEFNDEAKIVKKNSFWQIVEN